MAIQMVKVMRIHWKEGVSPFSAFHVFPGKLSRREQRGSAAAEAGFQWRWFVGPGLGEHSLVWFFPISLSKRWMGTDFSALCLIFFAANGKTNQNKLNTEFLDTLSQLMGDADEHQILMNNWTTLGYFQRRSQTHCSNMLYSAPYVYKKNNIYCP